MIDGYIQAMMVKEKIPGLSIAIVQEGEVVLVKGYSLANIEHSVPTTGQTVYEIASIGETLTATARSELGRGGSHNH